AVETEAADGIVDVRRVAREKHAAFAERRRDALVHLVQIAVNEVIRLRGRLDSLQSGVRGFVTERLLVGFLRTSRKERPPSSSLIVAGDLEEADPLARIGEVVAIAAAEHPLEVGEGREHEKALREGVALECDAECFADRAATTVGADDV